ncbi:hypothetical protein E2C01_096190 [Portunus trituberculatus]|uniref:Uncharacterized protein n=1 Tax=Portunus trituberculatus TaxID=210409 RepID=A0A5B7K5Y2_PORTR|nr:hypothetical protein [Portunus trituberculatus]
MHSDLMAAGLDEVTPWGFHAPLCSPVSRCRCRDLTPSWAVFSAPYESVSHHGDSQDGRKHAPTPPLVPSPLPTVYI